VKFIYETQCDESDTVIDQKLDSGVSFLLICVFVKAVIRRRNVKWMPKWTPEVGGGMIDVIIIGAISDGKVHYSYVVLVEQANYIESLKELHDDLELSLSRFYQNGTADIVRDQDDERFSLVCLY